MNLDYIIKKCEGFGFTNSARSVKINEIPNKNIIYIRTRETIHEYEKTIAASKTFYFEDYEDIDEMITTIKNEFNEDASPTFIVEVGNRVNETDSVDVRLSMNELTKIIDDFTTDDMSKELIDKYKSTIKLIIDKPLNYLKYEYNATFLKFIESIYLLINDGYIQHILLKILQSNGRRIDTLMANHPIATETKTIETVRPNKMFNDMKIVDPFFVKEVNEDTETDDILRRLTSQKITQFNGFGDSFSLIDNTKKNINAKNTIPMRNYEVINMLVRNKIATEPITTKTYNFEKLIKMFESYKSFSVIYEWPCYEANFVFVPSPNSLIEVNGENGNVILNVIFRFMCVNFFGMYSIVNTDDKFMKYII